MCHVQDVIMSQCFSIELKGTLLMSHLVKYRSHWSHVPCWQGSGPSSQHCTCCSSGEGKMEVDKVGNSVLFQRTQCLCLFSWAGYSMQASQRRDCFLSFQFGVLVRPFLEMGVCRGGQRQHKGWSYKFVASSIAFTHLCRNTVLEQEIQSMMC